MSDLLDKFYKSRLYCAHVDDESEETVHLWFKTDTELQVKWEAYLSKERDCSLDFVKTVIKNDDDATFFKVAIVRSKESPDFLLPNEYWDEGEIKKGRSTETIFDVNELKFTPWLRFFRVGVYAGTTFKEFNDFYVGLALVKIASIVALEKDKIHQIIGVGSGLK